MLSPNERSNRTMVATKVELDRIVCERFAMETS
jgi:hypothetical protein